MSVIPLTVFFSLVLAGLFIALFAHEQRRQRFASPERDSLLPLADEQPRTAAPDDDHDAHDHDHGDGRALASHSLGDGWCGCRDGTRPPCTGPGRRSDAAPARRCREHRSEGGCLKRTAATAVSPRSP